MSGGHFDYKCFKIADFAAELQWEIEHNKEERIAIEFKKEETLLGYALNYSPKTIELLENCQKKIEEAGKLAHAIEWLYSGETREETFAKDVEKIREIYENHNNLFVSDPPHSLRSQASGKP